MAKKPEPNAETRFPKFPGQVGSMLSGIGPGNMNLTSQNHAPTTSSQDVGVPGSSSFGSSISSGHRVGFKKLLSNIAFIIKDDDESGGMSELDNYLKDKLLPKDMELDLLAWWETNEIKYPTLQRTPKDILAILVSTVASESSFTTTGRLVSPHRSQIHPKTLEALMCAQSWLLNEIRATCSGETEVYCCSVEFDYEVEEENTKESGTTSLDDFV
ncbi:unnamed protein product [Lactuca saligna]|uniref:HAT C-terminal dimerisation domain-containing protein n=1 Tax=Lactuca saligna TaxID=75948 RepID=A0AA35ZWJ3_LACSI|nr:unnamed protein product [Lactuca saligna]